MVSVHHFTLFSLSYSSFVPMRNFGTEKTLLNYFGETKMAIQDYSDNIILVELPSEPDIRKELDKVMEIVQDRTDCDVLVDFSRVDIMVSLSLSGCIQLHKLLNASGRHLIFFNVTNLTKDIFKVTCFDNIFEFADDFHDATTMLSAACSSQPTDS